MYILCVIISSFSEGNVDEVELVCAVYGDGIVFPVKIALDAKVSALQIAIVNEKKDINRRFNVDPATLKLYLAKRGDGWLPSRDDDVLLLKQGEITMGIKNIVNDTKLIMDETATISESIKEAELPQPSSREIHVLVQLSSDLQNQGSILVRDTLEINGLSFTQKYLERHVLVNRIKRTLEYYRFMVISSSPATGKTSLIQLAHKHFQFTCRVIHCKEQQEPYEELKSIGIDLKSKTTSISKFCVVVLDDAHNYYSKIFGQI